LSNTGTRHSHPQFKFKLHHCFWTGGPQVEIKVSATWTYSTLLILWRIALSFNFVFIIFLLLNWSRERNEKKTTSSIYIQLVYILFNQNIWDNVEMKVRRTWKVGGGVAIPRRLRNTGSYHHLTSLVVHYLACMHARAHTHTHTHICIHTYTHRSTYTRWKKKGEREQEEKRESKRQKERKNERK
jgi:hypothetical protein